MRESVFRGSRHVSRLVNGEADWSLEQEAVNWGSVGAHGGTEFCDAKLNSSFGLVRDHNHKPPGAWGVPGSFAADWQWEHHNGC